jgi:UDP-GlcNAc:undecaprenyl-phosphate GlcNAc-1-phosphate transferase
MNNGVLAIVIFLTSLTVSLLLMPRLARIATKVGLIDHPNHERKVHKDPIPLVGGLGMVLAFAIACIAFIPLGGMRGFFAGVVLLFIVGFLDDSKELGHRWKFVAQIIAAFMMMYQSNVYLHTFGDLLYFGDINFGIFTVPMTIFCVVGIPNAINMIDGLDGLAGGISFIAFLAFAILSFLAGYWEYFFVSVALCGATLGFLRFNWNPAQVFMGDAGSLFLGFSLVYLSIIVTQGENSIIRPVVPLLIIGVPITDTLTLIAKRLIVGRSPFSADTFHLHHMFIRFGLNRKQAVIAILGLCSFMSLIGILGTVFKFPEQAMFIFFLVYFSIHFFLSFWSDRRHVAAMFSGPERRKHPPDEVLRGRGVKD